MFELGQRSVMLERVKAIVREWNEAPGYPRPDPYEFMGRVASVFDQ
jgi:hypothetical protein